MSEQENADATEGGAEQQSAADPIVNIKSEFSRKFGNLSETTKRLEEANRALDDKLAAILQLVQTPKAQPEPQANLEELWITDPAKAAAIERERIKSEVAGELTAQQVAQQERTATLAQLVQDYPELNQPDSEIYQEVMKTYNNLPARLKDTAEGYRLAVREGAARLGAIPVTKRGKQSSSEEVEEVISGGSRGKPARPTSTTSELDPMVEATARLFGLDPADKKTKERLKARSKRNFNKWE